jgi:RecB family exonuclease
MIGGVGLRPLVLLVPSAAAGVELPRRLAMTGRALAGIYAFTVRDLAKALAWPVLLGSGRREWTGGHDALLAARLLEEPGAHPLRLGPDMPLARVAAALARTLSELRRCGIGPAALQALAQRARPDDDRGRLLALADLYRRFDAALEDAFADPACVLRAAATRVAHARWLTDAEVLVADDLELEPLQRALLATLAQVVPVRRLAREQPPGLQAGSFAAWAAASGIAPVAWADTPFAPLAPAAPPRALGLLRARLFEPAGGEAAPEDGAVALITAPGEGAEVRALARRLLAEAARGVPFEEMAVLLPRPEDYAPLLTDLFERLGIPHRLHPSLPLRTGRLARSLLLLFRCRELTRSAVMEFLTFAPVPFAELLEPETTPRPARWDAISRTAGVVSGLERWIIGLRAYAEEQRAALEVEEDPQRRQDKAERASDAEALLRLVELLSSTLEGLAGEATWPEWSARLGDVFAQWIARGAGRAQMEHQAVAEVLADLAGLGSLRARARWPEVEAVLEARFEWERMPLEPREQGAVHLGALDAVAGVPFRVVAIPGLVEGGFPGVLRPDPFLLDAEREALAATPAADPGPRQLSLFDHSPAAAVRPGQALLPTSQDRLRRQRRLFHRALGQARERLVLSYPRADSRSGRERMPSLFFVAAAAALRGRPLSATELEAMVVEDGLDALEPAQALDRSERDRLRVRQGGEEEAVSVAAGCRFFQQSRLAAQARWSSRLTRWDGLIEELPPELAAKLDPVTASWPVSASRLAAYTRCGFLYFLQYVLRLEPALEPEERKRLDPLERGDAFHRLAEAFLRDRRDKGELPVRDTPEARARLLEMADEKLDDLVAKSPPRYTLLWERERGRFRQTALTWLEREAAVATRTLPAYFEVCFGPTRERAPGEPHGEEPLEIDLGEGRTLRVAGKIDRIDRRPDGSLVLRDYKTGRAPRDEGGLFRGAKQLQVPFYILAAAKLFPDAPVVEAFLDYVDGGRQVALDPASVRAPRFREVLGGVVDSIAEGLFVQEPSSCEWCDYTAVCGPRGLIERRRGYKVNDARVQRVLRLRDL